MESDRFGLPLSLVEALKADPSSQAAELAELLTDTVVEPRTRRDRRRPNASMRLFVTGLTAAVGIGAYGHATASGLEGRWVMVGEKSSFAEDLTGPAPDSATLTVTRDDADRLVYRLSEARDGAEVASGAYDVSFTGGPSASRTGAGPLQVSADRTARGEVVIRAPRVGALQAVIRLRMSGPNTAMLEHDLEGDGRILPLERLSLVRDEVADAPGSLAANVGHDAGHQE